MRLILRTREKIPEIKTLLKNRVRGRERENERGRMRERERERENKSGRDGSDKKGT